MRKNRISETMGNINTKYVDEAAAYTAEKKAAPRNLWLKWGAVAVCFALMISIGFWKGNDSGMHGEIIQDREPIVVTIQKWKDEGFICTVSDPDIHESITEGCEVLIRFRDTTKISGSNFKYDAENPNAQECGLEVGTKVQLYFAAVDYKSVGGIIPTEIIPVE